MKPSMLVLVLLFTATLASAQLRNDQPPQKRDSLVSGHVAGTYDLKVVPQDKKPSKIGRYKVDKTFHGDLEGTSSGQMLTGATTLRNTEGYVGMEEFTGTLKGRRGSFMLQQSGTIIRGSNQVVIMVVPDSGTGELQGLVGRMTIGLEGKKHTYEFEYSIPGHG